MVAEWLQSVPIKRFVIKNSWLMRENDQINTLTVTLISQLSEHMHIFRDTAET